VKLTPRQMAWLSTVTANGMTVAQAAVNWAAASPWGGEDATALGAFQCLSADAEEGEFNGAPCKQARLYLAVLAKLVAPEAAEAAKLSANQEADEAAAAQAQLAQIESIWGTRRADAVTLRPDHPEGKVSLHWAGVELECVVWAPGNDRYAYRLATPTGQWVCISRPAEDPTDGVSGWGNAYGD